jgi:hypothetical protein
MVYKDLLHRDPVPYHDRQAPLYIKHIVGGMVPLGTHNM